MSTKRSPNPLAGYPIALVEQIQHLIASDQFAAVFLQRYPHAHSVRTDTALYAYVQGLKSIYLKNSGPLNKVAFDSTLQVVRNALGTHSRSTRIQGAKLSSRREIRIATVFKLMPPEFLRMIVVHELAHIKENNHDKAFYQLCRHMEPDYHQLEFDLRACLCYLDAGGTPLWPAVSAS